VYNYAGGVLQVCQDAQHLAGPIPGVCGVYRPYFAQEKLDAMESLIAIVARVVCS
jgi:hypothetical protein